MYKIVYCAEIVKHNVEGLHQINDIGIEKYEVIYEPLYEGLDTLKFKRQFTYLRIVLTKDEPAVKSYGYQEPVS